MRPVIVAIGYNRKDNLKRLLDALENATYDGDNVTLVVSIDHGGDSRVLEIADSMEWTHGEKIIRRHDKNLGLREHVLECADLSMQYGAAIIFEDDTYPSPYFYLYAKQALRFYKSDNRIFAISLYSQIWNGYAGRNFIPVNNGYDAYISQIECSWGECFIGERWKEFREWYKNNKDALEYSFDVPHEVYGWVSSYSKYLLYYIVEKDKYYVTPYQSFSTNFNSKGTHIEKKSVTFQTVLAMGTREYRFPSFNEAIKYDAFFESIDLKIFLERITSRKVMINYFGIKKNIDEYDYVLSSVLLPYESIKSYALELKPYELNVYHDLLGDDIFLYDVFKPKRIKRNWKHHYNLINYEIKQLSFKDTLFYLLYCALNTRNAK